jgi:D-alanyl-D-alanine carboxypeptidase/D-alanyl-D-alanine-endopeptidase (penicillin-binding protein 4)
LQGQQGALEKMISDSSMIHASVSFCLVNSLTGEIVKELNSSKSYSQASVMKLVTSAAALEKLGPDYTFKTTVGYRGEIKSGVLKGDIIIKGGGDPVLASPRFPEYYSTLFDDWVRAIRETGIKKVSGNVITDDSYYDYNPVPSGWNWEDIGNYYGAGVYGLSLMDNTLALHFRTGETGSFPLLISADPPESGILFQNRLTASGNSDNGYVFSSPYGNRGWINGQIPVNREDFVLRASLTDPPLLAARMLRDKLNGQGIKVKGNALTSRVMIEKSIENYVPVIVINSPPLKEIIRVLNQESVNLYAETMVKELGKIYTGTGSTDSGKVIIRKFLDSLGVETSGMFIEDGSGLSPQNALSSKSLCTLLYLMKNKGKYFNDYFSSLPEAGKNGTLKTVFRDPVFDGVLRAKSGTILRVKSYAGYLTAKSGRELIFCIIVNNYTGPQIALVKQIEELLKEFIIYE